ncbi:MAG TPA: Gfo/Idh/MocA family oxidoreductase [bacterium]|nr:Gfo/Idh/MocA family oxidoreductase [bacterium]
MSSESEITRRSFVKTTAGGSLALSLGSLACKTTEKKAMAPGIAVSRSANDCIQIGVIGIGGRGRYLLQKALELSEDKHNNCKVVAVCDVYARRRNEAAQKAGAQAFEFYRDLLDRSDINAVIIATPDHWHAPIALDAINAGKDVYLEKPMTHTVEEARQVHEAVLRAGTVLQVGSQTTSSDQWWKAREVVEKGMLGKMIMSQGSYHRNSKEGDWNYRIDPGAGPDGKGDDHINWEEWLGPAPAREWDPERFFRFRKFWDYSGGIATDLFYHVMAPLNLVWGEGEFPYRVVGTGGVWCFHDREVPDTFMLCADYLTGHSVVLSSSIANNTHIPGLIRGHEATLTMVEHGQFEGDTPYITVEAQRIYKEEFTNKWGRDKIVIKTEPEKRDDHMVNWLRCIRTREKPVLHSELGYKAMAAIGMSVQSFREGKVLYFDAEKQKVVTKAPKIKA